MAVEKMTENVEVVQTLSTYPNQEEGLSAEQLKAKFDQGPKALKEYLNNVLVPAVQGIQKAMDAGAQYGLDTTLSVAGRAADAGAVGTALAGKAPAGYGLGTGGVWPPDDDLNNAVGSGWYIFTTGIANTPYVGYGVVEVIANNNNGTILQRAHDLIHSSSGYYNYGVSVERVFRDGAWQPWEYINPPMKIGVEYRTTERWNCKPVYTKIVNAGQLPTNAQKIVELGLTNPQHLVECTVMAYSANEYQCVFPIAGASGIQALHYLADWNLVLQTTRDMSEYASCYATVKYTKTTD